MPVSSKRKKSKPALRSATPSKTSLYIDDFMDDTVDALKDDTFVLLSILQDWPQDLKEYYVLSRSKDGKLLEHNEGPVFKQKFTKALKASIGLPHNPVKIVVGYFNRDQVTINPEGLNFGTPFYAIQWKTEAGKLIPDDSVYNWNGYEVTPGGYVERSFL